MLQALVKDGPLACSALTVSEVLIVTIAEKRDVYLALQ